MSLFQEQRALVKTKILETSILTFKEKGYENATIDEITKAVGVAKGTFYNFFSSKKDILMAWAVTVFQSLDFSEAADPHRTTEENLNVFVRLLVRSIEEDVTLFRSFLQEILADPPDPSVGRTFDFLAVYSQILTQSKDAHVTSGTMFEVRLEVLNNALFLAMVNRLTAAGDAEGLEEYLQQIVRVCVHGILDRRETSW